MPIIAVTVAKAFFEPANYGCCPRRKINTVNGKVGLLGTSMFLYREGGRVFGGQEIWFK